MLASSLNLAAISFVFSEIISFVGAVERVGLDATLSAIALLAFLSVRKQSFGFKNIKQT